jgi:hypothetical protein
VGYAEGLTDMGSEQMSSKAAMVKMIAEHNAEIAAIRAELAKPGLNSEWRRHLIQKRRKLASRVQDMVRDLPEKKPGKTPPPAKSDEQLRASNKELRRRLGVAINEIRRLRGLIETANEDPGDWPDGILLDNRA